ncbi:hypothetical protein GUITHDRAFT_175426 [Guillardia theta CCMP2712]|uniref:Protein kinase domain-containing protein n=2 Tax=Guillardia theta TaxID=55529 RepID=L1JL32_GUITC|nr:hypothetical protein GUITHDRAFT_175426 [Guillardia theta CCMP2712]EKX49226.1 hypothetical protein GUITHDRAFT_175426 [Guillardia theta CCMP2712]|eukprot:XP_005836206.1 hypothetical protein GUITHDRAFT_175426 [Guillardia theta CCMP2712]
MPVGFLSLQCPCVLISLLLALCLPPAHSFLNTPLKLARATSSLSTCRPHSSARSHRMSLSPPSSKSWQEPFPDGKYDPNKAASYFQMRFPLAVKRLIEIISVSAGFLFRLYLDERLGRAEEEERARSKELVALVARLGPTFIKIGQSLSVRSDILPPCYVQELQSLQDRVPPFPSSRAIDLLEEAWGDSGGVKGVLSYISPEPVAAASLGQVYKGRLKDGREVAIKIQRPNSLEQIACDLYLLRLASPLIAKFELFSGVSSVEDIIDEWGLGFVNELDYQLEAESSKRFIQSMRDCGLTNVMAPEVVEELSTRNILITEWVNGQRLDRAQGGDIGKLCALALNAYLTMMLDTGLLHCDPHPGNLLRTDGGKLCILDWGLVTVVEEDLQYSLVDYIAHLTTGDTAAIPRDLEALGFVQRGREADVREAGIVELLTGVQEELADGNALKKIDVPRVIEKLVAMTRKYGNLFQIPPYFAYIIRAFTVLEGIGMIADDNYSILQECYPYLARRLVTDSSPRTRVALKEMLYGSASASSLNVSRLVNLAGGMQKFASSTREDGSAAVDEALAILLSKEGNYLQELLLEELARLLEALGRQTVSQIFRTPAGRLATSTLKRQQSIAERIGPAAVFLPFALPARLFSTVEPYLEVKEEDVEALKTARDFLVVARPFLSSFLRDALNSNQRLDSRSLRALAQEVLPRMQEMGPGASALLARLAETLRERAKKRLVRDGKAVPTRLARPLGSG